MYFKPVRQEESFRLQKYKKEMRKQKRYFQWIDGEMKGDIVLLESIEEFEGETERPWKSQVTKPELR